MTSIGDNLKRLRETIEATCARIGRNPSEIAIVAVTKTVPPDKMQEAVDAGIRILGENRVQEAMTKIGSVKGEIAWHMVGHLQRNKVKKAIGLFDMIQSVDSLELAQEIDRRSAEQARITHVLVEVNTSGESTKFGIAPEQALDLVADIAQFGNTRVEGLMTIGALTTDEPAVRKCFSLLRHLAEQIEDARIQKVDMQLLSMGMSSDYIWAIEEGSNMLRIGTAIFGNR